MVALHCILHPGVDTPIRGRTEGSRRHAVKCKSQDHRRSDFKQTRMNTDDR